MIVQSLLFAAASLPALSVSSSNAEVRLAPPVEHSNPSPPAPPPPPAPRPVGPNLPVTAIGNPGNWISTSDYPAQALRAELEGTTAFRLDITRWGTVADCSITQSSGHAILDEATCRAVVRRARFNPATGKDSLPTNGTYSNVVKWKIPNDVPVAYNPAPMQPTTSTPLRMTAYPRQPAMRNWRWNYPETSDYPEAALKTKQEGTALFSLIVKPDGMPADCKITKSSGSPHLDLKTCAIVVERGQFAPALDVNGDPTMGKVESGIDWRLPTASEVGSAGVGRAAPRRTLEIPELFRDPVSIQLSFVVTKEGRMTNCAQSMTGKMRSGKQNICDEFQKANQMEFAPYRDAKGDPIERKVTMKYAVEFDPPLVGSK